MTTNTKKPFHKKFIGDKAFYMMVLSVAVPIMIQNGITNFVGMLDNIMVGRIGMEQMSGVSIVNQLNFVYFLCMFGGLGGIGIFTAQFYGNDDMEGVRHTFRAKFLLGVFLTVAAILIYSIFGKQLISLYLNESTDGGDLEKTLAYAYSYMKVLFFMFPGNLFLHVYSSTLRESGETKVPMIAGICAVFTNLILNYVLIYGKLGLPALGVVGAAIATVISRYVEAGIIVIWTHVNKDKAKYIVGMYKTFKIPVHLIKDFIKRGFPLLLNESLWSLGQSMLVQSYSLRGLNAIAAINIANTMGNLFNIVFIAMGDAVAIIVGQLLGAGKPEEAKDTDNKIIAFSVGFSVLTGLLLTLLSGFFPKFYDVTEAAKVLATQIIIAHAVFQPLNAFNHASYFTIRSGGKTFITFLFDSCFTVVVSLPIAFFLSRFTVMPVLWIIVAVQAAEIIKAVIGFILIKKNIWINKLS